tara:strand:+ start:13392 stop:13961 length:570 start_codon:yes stop_codon:yes gene_type:complete
VKTRIRYHRKLRRWTQPELARQIGTTAATISRLETADMSVSIEWLQRFADVFGVAVSALIDDAQSSARIPCVGTLNRGGTISSDNADERDDVTLEALARNPIAVRVHENIGNYCAGDIIIADRLPITDIQRALGRDCFVAIEGEDEGFGRFVSSGHGTYLLVPPEPGAQARDLPDPGWVAPVVMLIRHL